MANDAQLLTLLQRNGFSPTDAEAFLNRWASVGPGASLLGVLSYQPGSNVVYQSGVAANSSSLVAIDTTNLRLPVAVPTTGRILAKWTCRLATSATGVTTLGGFLIGATEYGAQAIASETDLQHPVVTVLLTGLTPGATVNLDAAWTDLSNGGQATIIAGPGASSASPFVIEAWSA